MDLSKTITYNGLTALPPTPSGGGGAVSGYVFEEVNQSNIEVAAWLDKRALHDGVDASDVYLGARSFRAIVSVYGSTKGDFWDKAQDLLAAFSPTLAYSADTANLGFLPFKFYQPTADISTWPVSAYPDGIPMQLYLRPAAPPAYTTRRVSSGGVTAKGLSESFTVALIARNPIKFSQAEVTTGDTNLGDYFTFPTITLVTTSTSSGTVVFTIGSDSLSVSVSGSSSTYVVDCDQGTVHKNGSLRQDLILGDGLWFPRFDPGANSMNVTGTGAGLTMSRSFRHAWA